MPASQIQAIFDREIAQACEDMEPSGHIFWLVELRGEILACFDAEVDLPEVVRQTWPNGEAEAILARRRAERA
jgi:hypothetical protein